MFVTMGGEFLGKRVWRLCKILFLINHGSKSVIIWDEQVHLARARGCIPARSNKKCNQSSLKQRKQQQKYQPFSLISVLYVPGSSESMTRGEFTSILLFISSTLHDNKGVSVLPFVVWISKTSSSAPCPPCEWPCPPPPCECP